MPGIYNTVVDEVEKKQDEPIAKRDDEQVEEKEDEQIASTSSGEPSSEKKSEEPLSEDTSSTSKASLKSKSNLPDDVELHDAKRKKKENSETEGALNIYDDIDDISDNDRTSIDVLSFYEIQPMNFYRELSDVAEMFDGDNEDANSELERIMRENEMIDVDVDNTESND